MDILLSLSHAPTVVINDLPGMTARHGNRRVPGFFQPHAGAPTEPTAEKIALAEEGTLCVSIPELANINLSKDDNFAPTSSIENDHGYSTQPHPVTQTTNHYSLADEFHKRNVKSKKDKIRYVSCVQELRGKLNTQRHEQLFRTMVKHDYYLNSMTPGNYMFTLRLLLSMRNSVLEQDQLGKLKASSRTVPCKAHLPTSSIGRISVQEDLPGTTYFFLSIYPKCCRSVS